MSTWDDRSDDELLAELGDAMAEQQSVSERRRTAARAAFTWRAVDEELATLLHDSALDAGAAVRSGTVVVRTLSFGWDGLTLELEVEVGSAIGQVIPEGAAAAPVGDAPAKVTLHRPSGAAQAATADPSGFFRLADVEPGPARFVVERGGTRLITPWVTL